MTEILYAIGMFFGVLLWAAVGWFGTGVFCPLLSYNIFR